MLKGIIINAWLLSLAFDVLAGFFWVSWQYIPYCTESDSRVQDIAALRLYLHTTACPFDLGQAISQSTQFKPAAYGYRGCGKCQYRLSMI